MVDHYPTPTPPTSVSQEQIDTDLQILEDLPTSLPDSKWGEITRITYQGTNPILNGLNRTGKIITNDNFSRYENLDLINKLGWIENPKGGADGIDGEMWEYNKTVQGKKRILRYSYSNRSLNPDSNGVSAVKCPCTYQLDVFLSDPF